MALPVPAGRALLEAPRSVDRQGRSRRSRIHKRVYPHLLRHTVAQRLADEGMREELLQQFLGHEAPETTQRYYKPKRAHVKEAYEEAMGT